MLDESIRLLLLERDARKVRLKTLLSGVDRVTGALQLSSEDTVNLIEQHLPYKGSSRLLVLIVAAAYEAAKTRFSIASDFCDISFICFIGYGKISSTNTKSSFFASRIARLVRL